MKRSIINATFFQTPFKNWLLNGFLPHDEVPLPQDEVPLPQDEVPLPQDSHISFFTAVVILFLRLYGIFFIDGL